MRRSESLALGPQNRLMTERWRPPDAPTHAPILGSRAAATPADGCLAIARAASTHAGGSTFTLAARPASPIEPQSALGRCIESSTSIDLAGDGVWSVAANNVREQPVYGWGLTCGTVRYEAVTTLAKGAMPMIQPGDLSNWGPSVPAGQYTRITHWGLHESCVLDDAAGIPFIVLGHNRGVIRSTGVVAGGSHLIGACLSLRPRPASMACPQPRVGATQSRSARRGHSD